MAINGTNFADVLVGTNLADIINGLAGNDVLVGAGGNDTLDGGLGADTMVGGLGNDIYIVDNVGDIVAEAAGEGIDTIMSSIGLSLSAAGRLDVENLTLTGVAAINGVGNALANRLIGNDANNSLSGLAGSDTMFGLGGNDSLFGGSGNDFMVGGTGNDLLNGGIGADNMRGEAGNDTYVVDDAGDVVTESAGAGIDLIQSSIGLSLGVVGRVDVENLTLTGVGNNTGVGNSLGNTITGNAGNNTLSGLAGNDTLIGQGGNDSLFGSTGNDVVSGGFGNDFHSGGFGSDTIVTGTGSDTIIFNTALGAGNVDFVSDFSPLFDTIQLENSVFTGLAAGPLAPGFFGAGDLNDRIIYNSVTGALFYDPDGLGGTARTQFATLSPGLAMTAADFVVV